MSRDSGLGPVLGALYTGITRSVSPLPDRSGWGGRHFARVVSGRVFADETGKAAGKRIGFLFRGELLCSPSPNCRIESGHFAITPFYMDEGEKMWSLLNSLREEM